jgi:hypothetical protein
MVADRAGAVDSMIAHAAAHSAARRLRFDDMAGV